MLALCQSAHSEMVALFFDGFFLRFISTSESLSLSESEYLPRPPRGADDELEWRDLERDGEFLRRRWCTSPSSLSLLSEEVSFAFSRRERCGEVERLGARPRSCGSTTSSSEGGGEEMVWGSALTFLGTL